MRHARAASPEAPESPVRTDRIEKLVKKSAFFGEQLTVADNAGAGLVQLPDNCEQQPIDAFVCRGPVGGASAGFLVAPGVFVFDISGSDFGDNVVLWTNPKTRRFHYAVETVDGSGDWGLLAGSVDSADIADEAQDRSLLPGDFEGFLVRPQGGDDVIRAGARKLSAKGGRPGAAGPPPRRIPLAVKHFTALGSGFTETPELKATGVEGK
jgi:hypothetical protein